MVRLLRRALRLGFLAGIGVGIVKAVRGRKAPDPWADSWVSTGAAGATRPSPAPVPAAAPKPPAPAASTAPVATPPPASPKPPAPAAPSSADVAAPPPAAPSPPAPEGAAAESSEGDGESGDGESGDDAGEPAPKASTRPSKPSRTGPARKSPTGRAEEPPGERLWVQANDGVCPQSHPVKAKLSSKIFHTPGARNYSRTKADRCYPDESSAQADGLRPALR
jgi:hypothetical protein